MSNVQQLQDVLMSEISNLDRKSGTLLQHIPNFSRNLFIAISQHQEFHEMLGQKMIQELIKRKRRKELTHQKQLETSAKQAQRVYQEQQKMDLSEPKSLIENIYYLGK